MNTEEHYKTGGEDHYKRVRRLGLSWCRSNITKYAERTKGTPVSDLIKVIDYAAMELEEYIMTEADAKKLAVVSMRVADLNKRAAPVRAMETASNPVCAPEQPGESRKWLDGVR